MRLVWVLGLVASTARAEPPAGEYTIAIGGDRGLVLPSEISHECEMTPEGEVCILGDIATDATGAVAGSAVMTAEGPGLALDLDMAVDGQMSGSTDKPRAVLDFDVNGTAHLGSEFAVTGRARGAREFVTATGSAGQAEDLRFTTPSGSAATDALRDAGRGSCAAPTSTSSSRPARRTGSRATRRS
jgi:hypothetical protein